MIFEYESVMYNVGPGMTVELVSIENYRKLQESLRLATMSYDMQHAADSTRIYIYMSKYNQAIIDKYRLQNKLTVERIKHKETKEYLAGYAGLYFQEAFKNKYGVDLNDEKRKSE